MSSTLGSFRHAVRRGRPLLTVALACAALLSLSISAVRPPPAAAQSEETVNVDLSSLNAGTCTVTKTCGTVGPDLLGGNVEWPTAENLGNTQSASSSPQVAVYTNVTDFLGGTSTTSGVLPLQLLRFPGGLESNCYDWEQGVWLGPDGVQPTRPSNEPYYNVSGKCFPATTPNYFGTDEFFQAGYAINPNFQPLITVNVCSITTGQTTYACQVSPPNTGTDLCPNPTQYLLNHAGCQGADRAADWVAYMNGTTNSSATLLDGTTVASLAQKRARNNPNHQSPYGVRYFELGNEVSGSPGLTADIYVNIMKAYEMAMHKADPTIQLGGVLDPCTTGNNCTKSPPSDATSTAMCGLANAKNCWNYRVAASGVVSFLIPHLYRTVPSGRDPSIRSAPYGTALPPTYWRSQTYSFTAPTTPTGGTYNLDLYPWSPDGDSQLRVIVDGAAQAAQTVTVKMPAANTPSVPSVVSFTEPVTSKASHTLTVSYQPDPTSTTQSTILYLSGGRVCATGPCDATLTPLNPDMSPVLDDPSAIAMLYPGAGPGSFDRQITVPQGATKLLLKAYGTPVLSSITSPCPTLIVTLDKGQPDQQQLSPAGGISLANPNPVGATCYSVDSPDPVSLAMSAQGPHTITVAATGPTGSDADIFQVQTDAPMPGTTPGSADLTPNPSGPQGLLQETFASSLDESSDLDKINSATDNPGGLPLIVSEWNVDFTQWVDRNKAGYTSPDNQPLRESILGMLWDAHLMQYFIQHNVTGTAFFPIDGDGQSRGGGWRLLHCHRDQFLDMSNDCRAPLSSPYPGLSTPPYLSLPGQLFSMLNNNVDASWIAPSVTPQPIPATPAIFDADWKPIQSSAGQTPTEIQSVATRGSRIIHVELINIADHAVSTDVTVSGATPDTTATATLMSLSGAPLAANGCNQDALGANSGPPFPHSYNCNHADIAPTSTQMPVPATGPITVSLPSDSFSILTIPTTA